MTTQAFDEITESELIEEMMASANVQKLTPKVSAYFNLESRFTYRIFLMGRFIGVVDEKSYRPVEFPKNWLGGYIKVREHLLCVGFQNNIREIIERIATKLVRDDAYSADGWRRDWRRKQNA